jgi:GxxExxY protein
MERLELEGLTEGIIGAAIEVHRELGPGFLESFYEEALCHELTLQGIPFDRQVSVPVVYRSRPVGHHRLDLVVHGLVVVELKGECQRNCVSSSGLDPGDRHGEDQHNCFSPRFLR